MLTLWLAQELVIFAIFLPPQVVFLYITDSVKPNQKTVLPLPLARSHSPTS